MDGTLAIERNRQALKRVLLTLVAMASLSTRTTLPRHLRNAVLRLLRPAEAAARRLIIALAHGLTVSPPPPRKAGTALRQARHFMPVMPPEPAVRAPLHSLPLPLLDPLRRATPGIKRPSILPRICVPGVTVRLSIPVRLPPSPFDPLDATRLGMRLHALGQALDDLPREALRFARWQARQHRARAAGKIRRWPLRPGQPPGSRVKHDVQDILTHAHQLAWWALEHPDTS
jgi:hypothetical protein